MSKREKILAVAVLCLGVGLMARYLYGSYEKALAARESQLGVAREELANVKRALNRGQLAVRHMDAWQQKSLPENREKASSLYQAWLLATAKKAGLKVDDIKPAARPTPSKAFTAIGYQLEASGSLQAVAAMLYEFYRSPQLHQITRLRLLRPVGATELQVSMEAEALSLPGATATDSLPEGDSQRLNLKSLADYQKSLGERDLVTAYKAPAPVRATARRETPEPPKFDDAEHARFSASVGVGDKFQAWIHVRTTGETLHLSEGDSFKVGELEGQIVSVDLRTMVYQAGDKKYRVTLDQSLRKGTELDADGNAANREPAERPES
jgi:hypothetical protein